MAQILKVIVWKTLILRRRRWIISLLEIVVPILLFWFLIRIKSLLPNQREKIAYDLYPGKYNSDTYFFNNINIAYTPSNQITDSIMKGAVTKLSGPLTKVNLVSKSNEEEVVQWLRKQYVNETSSQGSDFNSIVSAGFGVIFLESDNLNNLKYILRPTTGNIQTTDNTLYGEQNGYYMYIVSGFSVVQAAIDQAYLNTQNIQTNDAFVGRLPRVEFSSVELMALLLPFIISSAFSFAIPSLFRGIIEEKTSGIKEMAKIMGLKSWINWLSWVIYSLLAYIPVTLVVSVILTMDSESGPSVDTNFFYLWIIFMLFTFALITLIFAFSTFFTNGTIAVISGVTVWYTVTIVLDSVFVSVPYRFTLGINLLTCLWPSVALQWALNTIGNFQKNGVIWTVSDLFDDGAGGGRVSVGLAVIMLCVDIVFYSIITWYVDSVKPGPYGRAKPLNFIFQCFKKADYDSQSDNSKEYQKNYEPAPKDTTVGIRIENLRKTFNYGKVVAVENVDLDIYEGNITALLGHNGAGKTTTMSILTGFFSPTSGKIIVKGKNIFDNMDEFRSNLGLCPQHNLVFSFFTVLDHLVFFGMLKGLSMAQAKEEGTRLLSILKVDEKKDVLISKLSGGMKRKLCLSIALMGNPKVLILDEPTSGMDPESRRHVWDMLLGFRGHRTIIITTHYMEEADVLGDRIAIMDHGQVSCYGTSMFLKKLYGTGYQLNISKLEKASVSPISNVVQQYISNVDMKVLSPTQLTYSIKPDEVSQFPALLSALDILRNKQYLTAMNITCTTIEDVFLKVAERPGDVSETNETLNNEYFMSKFKNITGWSLTFMQFKALVYKRLLTRKRCWINTLIFIIIPILLMAYNMVKMVEDDYTPDQPKLLISLSSFPGVHVPVSSNNDDWTNIIKNMVTSGKATYEAIPLDTEFYDYFGKQINKSLIQYERDVIAGFKYNGSLLGSFSVYFSHSPPLVYNMIANTLLQKVKPQSSITVYNHPVAVKLAQDVCDMAAISNAHVFQFPMISTYVSLGILILVMSFISFPLKERANTSKQLQLMAGVSPILYWTTTFLCDILMYFITVILMISTIFIFQKDGIFTASGHLGTLLLVFILFGFSGIAFAYFFSFLMNSSIKAAVMFMKINLILGTVLSVLLTFLGIAESTYDIYTFFLSFNPIFTFTCAFIHLMEIMYINGSCLSCGKNTCTTQDPFQFLETGYNSKHPNGINNFLIFLVVDAVIYFTLVFMIEYGIVKKLWFYISKIWIKMDEEMMKEDSDVLIERERVKSPQGSVRNTCVLHVNDLGKKYNRKETAVYGVSFQVRKAECFGLLGVNGAGKTTTFKMLTGEEIPNKGDANILGNSLKKHKSRFLAKIGYCPQFEAISKLLTGKEMLYVYALLRGIPSSYHESEISKWVEIMGLKEYADRPCGTYSGGNKRKLSTAMAFIGDPPVVFLDEPTSGVDPVSRRKLWDVMSKCQQTGQATVLTSHSMEECEALCNRLTIMVAGQMKCIGSPQYLKEKFGQGFTVKIKLLTTQQLQDSVTYLKQDIASYFNYLSIKDEHLGLLHYHVLDLVPLSQLFTKMEDLKRKHDVIEDYMVSDTTLEQVFMSFARAANSKGES